MTTPSKPEASLRELAAAEAVLCRRLHTGTVEGSTRETAAEMLDAALSARDEAGRCFTCGTPKHDGACPEPHWGTPAMCDRLLARALQAEKAARQEAGAVLGTRVGHDGEGRQVYLSDPIATPPASGEAGADAVGELIEAVLAERLARRGGAGAEHSAAVARVTAALLAVADIRRLAAVAPAGMVLVPRDTERKARLWDDLTAAKNAPRTDADTEWQRLALTGDKMAAIRVCRAVHGYSLTEARYVVETFVAATPPATAGEE